MNYKSQLGYIMDLLEITGKDLAHKINVDRTLVSKWKNNARQIKPNNVHFNNVIQALIDFNHERKDSILDRFFHKVYPKEDRNEPDYLEVCLHLWLDGHELGNFNNVNDWRTSKHALYATNVEIYQGNQGKRDAIIDFFNYALDMPAGQEIFISDYETQNWLFEDESYYSLYQDKIQQLIKIGHRLTIIHHMSSIDNQPKTIGLRKFNIYYSGNVTSYYNDTYKDVTQEPSIYIIHRQMAMTSICSDLIEDHRYITMLRDPFSISHYVKTFVGRLQHAKLLVSSFSLHANNLSGFKDEWHSIGMKSNMYYSVPQLPLPVFSEDLLQRIFKENNIKESSQQLLLTTFRQNQNLFFNAIDSHDVDLIIDQEELEFMFESPLVTLQEISSICRTKVTISQDLFRDIIKHVCIVQSKYPRLHITIMPFSQARLVQNIALWVFEDKRLYTINMIEGSNFVVSDAPMILTYVQEYLKQLLMENENDDTLCHYLD